MATPLLLEPAPSITAADTGPSELDEDFELDVRVVLTTHPSGKLACTTNDGCGSTCQNGASACNSFVGDPF
ncbi:FxLD family lanthipeptide [Nocardiopsis sp. CNT-189]|uniref:FxLD family lanthipeptide n=1 Tax=Nocardiopsis oceanisediminis TaxID=2816862 RepID=UPI003B3310BE